MAEIGVIGAGSWGTALSAHLGRCGHDVKVWSIDPAEVDMLNQEHEQKVKLPGVILPEKLAEQGNIQRVFAETDVMDLGTEDHEIVFVYDEAVGAVFYYLDGECILGAWDDGMKMNGNSQISIIRRMEIPCIIQDMGIGTKSAFLTDPEPDVFPGDADGDGEITVQDIIQLKKYIASTIDEGEVNAANCDVNRDGEVSVEDIIKLKKILASADD